MAVKIELDRICDVLREAAKAEIMPRFRNLGEGAIREKTEASDLVTEADEAAERFIRREIAAILPEATFVGEESVAADPSLLDKVDGAECAFIVDPVDGTYNFAAGVPLFGVMASVVVNGETVAGIIYDPVGDDWFAAEKGAGAFRITPEGSRARLSVAKALPLSEMVGTASTGFFPMEERAKMLNNLAGVRSFFSYRCAAHEYRLLAAGTTQFTLYNKLMPWDHLAGVLICAEAGAHVKRFDGSDYLPGHLRGGLLAAVDADSWQSLKGALV